MASSGLQILEIIPMLLSWVNALMSCVQPLWKVTVFISNGIVVAQVVWEGLWMFCLDKVQGVQLAAGASPGPAGYPNPLHHLSTCGPARPAVYLVGAKCTPCMEDKDSKACLVLIFQITFVISAALTLIPGCWTAHTIIRNLYDALVSEAQKRKLGASIYLD
ncbi:claudin-6-like [Dama dama]